MSKGRETPEKIAYAALRDLMATPGKSEDSVLELMASLVGRDTPLLASLPKYDDRGVAIVFVSHLEEALELAVMTHFAIPQDAARALFSYPTGSLREFAAKIAVGYALGIYGTEMRDDLRWIKDIRNAFAHVRFEIDFKTPAIKLAVEQLKIRATVYTHEVTVPDGGSAPIPMEGTPVPLDTRQRFTHCVATLTTLLKNIETKPHKLLGTPWDPYAARTA